MTISRIRAAKLGDAEGLARLHAATWRESYVDLLPAAYLASLDRADWMSPSAWRARIVQQGAWRGVFVVEMDDELVGFAGCRALASGPDNYRGEIAQIYVLRRAQRQGHGAQLMRHAADRLSGNGLTPFLLWVFIDNAPANAFYRRLGGTLLGRQKLTLGAKELEEQAYGWAGPDALMSPSAHLPPARS